MKIIIILRLKYTHLEFVQSNRITVKKLKTVTFFRAGDFSNIFKTFSALRKIWFPLCMNLNLFYYVFRLLLSPHLHK